MIVVSVLELNQYNIDYLIIIIGVLIINTNIKTHFTFIVNVKTTTMHDIKHTNLQD